MTELLRKIHERVNNARGERSFLDAVFGAHKKKVLAGAPVVLFGAGDLGREMKTALSHNGIFPVCFCDNDSSKSGRTHCGLPVISYEDLKRLHKRSIIVISAARMRVVQSITDQLIEDGFIEDLMMCGKSDDVTDHHFIHMYCNNSTVSSLSASEQKYEHDELLNSLSSCESAMNRAYDLLEDQHSRDLFIGKLALMASNEHFTLFKDFISSFSEPIREFGIENRNRLTEEYFYFNNDVIRLVPGEIYVDVGATDGDTVHTFVDACGKQSVKHGHIYALEPDPENFRELIKNTTDYENISCHELGLWSETKTLKFLSSANALSKETASISDNGDIEIHVVSLDDFLNGERVTFLKMDPPGNMIHEAIKGAAGTIAGHKPKLALGAYQTIKSIFEIPLLVNSMCPDYRLYLRHNTSHICDTVLYAVA